MNISYRWLKELAPTIEGTPEEISAALGMLGAPVDDLVDLSEGLDDIVVAKVEEVRAHPNADRLRICRVNAGGEALQVVCGAPNVEAGGYYPFAPVGATLPDGMQIRKAKLRGEVSEGMLCSARELGLGRDHAGLLALHGEWVPGGGFVDQLSLDDWRLVLDITPNRPDLLSHYGVARELAPGGVSDLRLPAFDGGGDDLEVVAGGGTLSVGEIQVEIEDAGDCPRYTAAVIEGVEVGPSPEWLASRLRAVGLRPINNVVDATNYVLHEVGQPLHAFDLDLLGNRVGVRKATAGESVKTLDGIDRKLDEGALVITDGDRPVALAGIMGGEDTEVGDRTSRVLLECALFDPLKVRKTAKALGLSTDASHRFERGVDPEGQPRALRRVVELILATAGGRVAGPALDAHPGSRERTAVKVRTDRVRRVLGVELSVEEIAALLEPIGFQLTLGDDEVDATVPSYRPDVTREVDVIEEIARRRGYDTFDERLSFFRPGVVPVDDQVAVQDELRHFFIRWGFLEARTAAFAPESEGRVALLNPLSAEESHLRDELTEGLLARVEHNWSHGVRAIRLYEIGSVFHPANGAVANEQVHVAAVVTGLSEPGHWSGSSRPFDIWDLQGLMEELAASLGLRLRVAEGKVGAALAPSESYTLVTSEGEVAGWGGLVRQKAIDPPAWADPVYAIEVEIRPAGRREIHQIDPLPEFPGIERDLALIVPQGVSAERVGEAIRSSAGDLLRSTEPFDLYQGKGLPEGTRSIAWRLAYRHPDRTLTDDEVDKSVDRVLQALDDELGVRRR